MATPKKKQPTPAEAAILAATHKPTAAKPTRSYAGVKVDGLQQAADGS